MPIALEPGGRYPVVLEIDKNKPEATRPTFYFKALAGRKWREAARISDSLELQRDSFQVVDQLYEAVKWGLVDWEHMIDPETGQAIPFNPDDLDLIIQPAEAAELIPKMLTAGLPTGDERKNSESPHSSNTENSAATAGPVNASAAPAI